LKIGGVEWGIVRREEKGEREDARKYPAEVS